MPSSLKSYEKVMGEWAISQLRQLADPLQGLKVVHVNSTRVGGGVAEILAWLCPLMNELGLDASWEVIDGNDEFFKTTKAFHNGMQGNPVHLTPKMIEAYEDTIAGNIKKLKPKLQEADVVFIHDPQPAGLIQHCPDRKGNWIWRCHIDASHPNRKIWTFIKSKVVNYDASIFSMPDFARTLPHPQFIIAPSIDPLSEKNCSLSNREVEEVLERLNIDPEIPLLTQVSRFDRFKDPLGVIESFRMVQQSIDAELVMAGGTATDDPEGAAVLEEVLDAVDNDPRIHVLLLPGDAHRTINAIQRASSIVIQKSLQEGFGLTVTEAMWKSKPVIGGNVGGIRLQVHNHYTGYLVDTPEGAALRIRDMLNKPKLIAQMGKTARRLVKDNFLLNRHLREYLTLMLGMRRGLSNHLFASRRAE